MQFFRDLAALDWDILLPYVINLLVALPCIVLHEMAHGYAAYKMGDTTAKERGRLSLNPLKHIDPLGLVLMITLGFGWAKPVPVNMYRFKNPKRGMAVTSLAGPVMNFIITIVVLLIAGIMYRSQVLFQHRVGIYVFMILVMIGIRSTMLGLFNLIPIPPLDGSKAVFSLLPDGAYYKILRYERYCMILVFVLCYVGAVNSAITAAGSWVLDKLCVISFFPNDLIHMFI